jgi:hypothetical protein
MQEGSIVECVKGHPGILEEGSYYTLSTVTKNAVLLFEVSPPHPYTGFHKDRFKEVQSPDEIPDILSEVLFDQIKN